MALVEGRRLEPVGRRTVTLAPSDVLLVGLGATAVCYYRVLLPAHELGCDYVGLYGDPPEASYATGLVDGETRMPDFTAYKLVVLQQPKGPKWLEIIRALQARGTVVVYEVDDWLHSIKNRPEHDFKAGFTNADLAQYEACMKACDAMIVSTPFLAGVYRHFNRRVFVCRNGIDAARYELTRPLRADVTVGWAGATGHQDAVGPWLQQVGEIMLSRSDVNFVSIGQPFARALERHFGPRRAITVPFAAIEQYPAAMTLLDVALAPATNAGWYRAKSDLRFLEAGALGIPLIGDPNVYPTIVDGVTGFHAATPLRMRRHLLELVDDRELRTRVGQAAREYVLEHRTMERMAPVWWETFETLVK